MPSLAKSPLAPVLGQRIPLRGPARLLFNSYARTRHQPKHSAIRVTTRTGDVFNVDRSSTLEWQLWAFGGFEPHFAELFGYLVSPGDRCVDVGANVGIHTVRLGRLAGPGGEVIAVEPDPDLARRNERNTGLNGLDNVRLVNAAAGEQPGQLQLFRPDPADTNRGRASLHHHGHLTGGAITVPVVTLDDLCGAGPVTLVKVDVEGHEEAVIHGAARVIELHAPAIVFEYAPELLDNPVGQTPFGWLTKRGYTLYHVRALRHPVTGRLRLALNHLTEPPPAGGDLLAVSGEQAARIRSLAS